MSNIKNRVRESMKWKKSYQFCANKLGISLSEYKKIRQELIGEVVDTVLKREGIKVTTSAYNLDEGTGRLEGIFSDEPLSPEEVEKKFKIDKTKWALASYWNKERPGGGYFVSANIVQRKFDQLTSLKDILKSIKLEYKPFTSTKSNKKTDTLAVLSIQDLHVGKKSIDSLDTVEQDFKQAIHDLVNNASAVSILDEIVFVLGGDLINMDTFGGTTTSGTPVDNNMSAIKAYQKAFDLMFWAVNFLKQNCKTLRVIYIPGNHSRLSESHIAYSLSKVMTDKDIIWDVQYKERKVVEFGVNFLGFEHGDFDTNKSFYAFATEFAAEWGRTSTRITYTGHYHKKKTTKYVSEDELNGFQLKILPSLSRTDCYHESNKWTNNARGAVIELFSRTKGFKGMFNYTA